MYSATALLVDAKLKLTLQNCLVMAIVICTALQFIALNAVNQDWRLSMNSEMQIFNNSEFGALGVMMIDGKAHFPATDCANILGYVKARNAIERHCKGALKQGVLTNGGMQEKIFIPEGDLYRLIVRSNLPNAIRFESWVFDEVLPSIRKHGAYMTPVTIDKILANPDFGIRLLTQLKEEQAKNFELAAQNEDLAIRLNESEMFWTIMKFNQHFNMRWDMKTCQCNGRAASAYSRRHGYEIQKCKTNDDRFEFTNSYAYEVLENLFLPKKSEG
jgi:prophage antirepressor-like protein